MHQCAGAHKRPPFGGQVHVLSPESGGHRILTFPYCEQSYAENVYKLPGSGVKEEYPFVTQAFSRNEVDAWLHDNGGELVEQEYWKFFTGEYGPWVRVPPAGLGRTNCTSTAAF